MPWDLNNEPMAPRLLVASLMMMQVAGTLVSLATCKVQEIVSSKGPGQSGYVITL